MPLKFIIPLVVIPVILAGIAGGLILVRKKKEKKELEGR